MTSRRSSLLNQQALKDGGISLGFDTKDINELMKQFPPSLTENARHSFRLSRGHSTFSSLNSTSNPTPGTGRKTDSSVNNAGNRQSQSVPRQLSQQGRSKSIATATFAGSSRISTVKSKNQGKPPQSAQVSRNTRPASASQSQSKIPTSSQKPRYRDRDRDRERESLMAKSVSMESLSWLQTPMMTPRHGRSPRTVLLPSGEDMKPDAMVKNLKIPPSQDRITLNELHMRVRELLERHGFTIVRQAKAVGCVTIAEYFNMCKFCLQQLMGDHFIEGAKNEELSAKLLDISVDMKYPGALSKSVLKSPNTPHQWPSALVFLAWLVYTMDKALTPVSTKRHLTELTNPEQYLNDQAQESYLNLFFQQISIGDVGLDEELNRYRKNVLSIYQLDEGDVPLSDIARILEEKEEQLRAIELTPDPRKETLLATQTRLKAIRAAKERHAELEALLEKYMDLETPRMRAISLHHTIKSAEIKLSSLINDVESQILSKEKEAFLINQIQYLKKQRETLDSVIDKIAGEVERREHNLSQLNAKFYDICSRLSICDVFNDYLQKLELLKTLEDMERIPRNPFTTAELKPWLKAANKIRRNTRSIFHKLDQHLGSRIEKAVASHLDYEQDELIALEAFEKLQVDIDNTNKQHELILKQLELDIVVINEEIAKCNVELEEAADETDPHPEIREETEALKKKINRIQSKEAIADNELSLLEAKANAVRLEYAEVEAYAQEELMKRIAFYLSRSIDLLESDSDDEDDRNDYTEAEYDFEDDEARVEAEIEAEAEM